MIRRPPRSTRTDTLFPTRRSSDLKRCPHARRDFPRPRGPHRRPILAATASARAGRADSPPTPAGRRSEEHTSELQSLMRISYAVFCLKKKKQPKNNTRMQLQAYDTSHDKTKHIQLHWNKEN